MNIVIWFKYWIAVLFNKEGLKYTSCGGNEYRNLTGRLISKTKQAIYHDKYGRMHTICEETAKFDIQNACNDQKVLNKCLWSVAALQAMKGTV